MHPELTLGCLVEVYVDLLLKVVDLDHVFGAVDALIARDAAAQWWSDDNET